MLPIGGDVAEGQSVILVCSVEKGTLPINVTLYQQDTGRKLHSKTVWKLQETYRISNVRGQDRGGYYCVFNNPANKAEQSPTFTITGEMWRL